MKRAKNTAKHQAALDAPPIEKPRGCGCESDKSVAPCGKKNCKRKPGFVPKKKAAAPMAWDERKYYATRQVVVGMMKFGIIRTLSVLFVRHFMLKPLGWAWMGWEFIKTVFSGWCTTDVYVERQADCTECPLMQATAKGQMYCGGCRCPKWWLSRLGIKNKFKKNHCPKGIHKR